jgi:hypothetical protein
MKNTATPTTVLDPVRHPPIQLILLTLLLITGCDREEPIAVYRAPKDPAPTTAPVIGPAVASASAVPFHWTLPPSWREVPSQQQMRFATFLVNENPAVELTVTPLGAEAADIPANVTRWRNQLGLPPASPEDLDKSVKRINSNNLDIACVDLATPPDKSPPQRMLAAIVPHGSRVWFFKLVGPAEIVAAQKQNFDAFVSSLAPGSSESAPPSVAQVPAPTNTSSVLRHWTAPPEWREIPNSTPPRMLAFKVGPDADPAELIVTRFPLNGAGSFGDNINRWRNQLGLGPIDDPNTVPLADIKVGPDGQGMLIEIENPGPDGKPARRMLVALTTAGDDIWFFKFTGPSSLVANQKDAFTTFLKSIEFSRAPKS